MAEAARTPTGAVRGARFGGLFEGRVGDRLALERAVRTLRDEGPVEVSFEVEGPRYSLYLSDAPVDASAATPERMQAFLDGLGEVVEASDADAPIESTLRCTEYYDDEVVETHIGLEDGAIAPVSRVRSRGATDELPRVDAHADGPLLADKPRRILIAVAAVLLIGLTIWQARVVDRVFGAPASELSTSSGPFGALVHVELEPGLGAYKVMLRRGTGYPLTGADVQRLEVAAASPLERAALAAVVDGEPVEARVMDAEGEVLARGLVRTDGLLLEEDAVVGAALPARIGATSIQLGMPVADRRRGVVQ